MPNTVKIVRFHQTGGPEVLQVDELPLPEPGPGEVRLRVKAIGLNRAEVMFRMGRYLVEPELPSKLGYEASGIVEAVGEGVERSWLGKTVSTVPAFAANKYGVYGEVAIVPAYAIALYPDKLSFEEGTSIWMQYLTAYGALVAQGRLSKGDFALITAASSSVTGRHRDCACRGRDQHRHHANFSEEGGTSHAGCGLRDCHRRGRPRRPRQ